MADENENGTFYVTGSTIGLPVTASSNCTAATAFSNASDIYRIEFSPIDFGPPCHVCNGEEGCASFSNPIRVVGFADLVYAPT